MNRISKYFLIVWIPISIYIIFNCSAIYGVVSTKPYTSELFYHGIKDILIPVILNIFFMIMVCIFLNYNENGGDRQTSKGIR